MALNITKENFETEVINSKTPVLIDFWATWCGPCKMIAPVIEEIAEEVEDVKVCKIDVDASPELAAAFGIQSIPTLVLMKNGEVVNKTVGFQSKNSILEFIGI